MKNTVISVLGSRAVWTYALGVLATMFLGVSLLAGQEASMTCGNTVSTWIGTQTRPVRAPDGTTAVVKVSSEDDHSKNSHLCMADYQLLITRSSEQEPSVVQILYTDNEWNRELSVRLSGFSHDGKRIFGVVSEGGALPMQQHFDYDTVHGQVRTVDLRKQLARISGDKCRATVDVIGTTETGVVVIQFSSGNHCVPASRWSLDFKRDRMQRISDATSVLTLER